MGGQAERLTEIFLAGALERPAGAHAVVPLNDDGDLPVEDHHLRARDRQPNLSCEREGEVLLLDVPIQRSRGHSESMSAFDDMIAMSANSDKRGASGAAAGGRTQGVYVFWESLPLRKASDPCRTPNTRF